MIEKYYTPEQLESLQRRCEEVGEGSYPPGAAAVGRVREHAPRAMDMGIQPTHRGGGTGPPLVCAGERLHRVRPWVFLSLKKMYQNEDTIREWMWPRAAYGVDRAQPRRPGILDLPGS